LTYTDDGYSGTWLDRPGLDELRDHAREGRFDVAVVLCPDRLARRYAYQVLLLEELRRSGVEALFCERPITESPDDQLLLQIQGAIAEYERAKILERCRRGRLHRARRGELAPPNPPYGYTYAARKRGGDGQIRIHEEESALVRQVFSWYVDEGLTLHRVLQRLNASSWTKRRGLPGWHASTVLAILRCEWYVGRAHYNRVAHRLQERAAQGSSETKAAKVVKTGRPRADWIEVPVPRIVDDALFARAQQRVADNRRFAARRLKRKNTYLLKGLLRCGACGYAYSGQTRTKLPKASGFALHRYYMCSKYQVPNGNGGHGRCQNGRLLVAGADEAVWTTVRDILLDGDALATQLESWLKRSTADPAADDRERLTCSRLDDLRGQRGRLIDAYQAGALDLADFRGRKEAIEERILAVEHELAELRSWASRRELAGRQVASAAAIAAELRNRLAEPDFATKQAILRLVVDKVVVDGQRLEIHLALPVSGSCHLSTGWGAKPHSPRNTGSLVNSEGRGVRGFRVNDVVARCGRAISVAPRRRDGSPALAPPLRAGRDDPDGE
jgi:site-specific DNA recombinase